MLLKIAVLQISRTFWNFFKRYIHTYIHFIENIPIWGFSVNNYIIQILDTIHTERYIRSRDRLKLETFSSELVLLQGAQRSESRIELLELFTGIVSRVEGCLGKVLWILISDKDL